MDKLEKISIEDLIPYARNSRTHSDEQVAQIAASVKEFGFTNPVLIDNDNGIIAGHGRVLAGRKLKLKEIPCIRLGHLTDAQKKAYVIADNKLALNSGWDAEMLKLELVELKDDGFNIDLIGFDGDELAEIFAEESEINEGLTDEDEVPEVPEEPVTKLGDVWILGNHRLMCGDSTSITDVEKLMSGATAQMLHADPPYGMGKQSDGVANDNLYEEKLDEFQMEWWATFRTFIADNASVYIWGNSPDLWRLWYQGGLSNSERLTMRNQIVWDKKHGQGMNSEGFRMYPTTTEHCLFFMIGEQGFNTNANNYFEGWEPIRAYLDGERQNMGWKIKDTKIIAGHSENSGCHWFDKSQWSMPTKEVYDSWKNHANGNAFKREYDDIKREYDYIKREYDDIKREYYETRAYFDNTHDNMTDVWDFSRVTGSDRHGHATPKPVEMMERVMKSSLPENGICIEPFGGSGSTLMGAEKTKRICYTMELQPKYCDVIIKRWEDYTGKKAYLSE